MIRLAVLLALLLSGCGGGSPAPPSMPPPTSTGWAFEHSPGMTVPVSTSSGLQFIFPHQDGVHYLTMAPGSGLFGTATLTFSVDPPAAPLVEVQPCSGSRPLVRLYFQRQGDNLSGAGEYEFYRWWSAGAPLDGSANVLSAAFVPEQWTSVYGKPGSDNPAAFAAALAAPARLGMTFGGCFAGHGVYDAGSGATTFVYGYTTP